MSATGAESRLATARERYRSGELRAAAAIALEAAELASAAGRGDLVAEAALLNDGIPDPTTAPTIERLARDALTLVPADARATRAQLLGQLSMALHHRGQLPEAVATAAIATEVAAAAGDPAAHVAALNATLLTISGSDPGERLVAQADAMLVAADRAGSDTGELFARNWRIAAAMRLADTATVAHQVDSLDVLAARSGLPLVRWNALFARAGLNHAIGRLRDAETAARSAREALPPSQRHQTEPLFFAQLLLISIDVGREPPEVGLARETTIGGPVLSMAMTARYDLEMGDRVAAQATFDALRPRIGLVGLDRRGLPALVAGIELAVTFADRDLASDLHARLEPFAAAMVASAVGAVGPVSHYLARAESLLGRHDPAVAHADDAAELAARGGFEPWHARARLALAECLTARARPGDLPRARRLSSLVAATARHLGMHGVEARSRQLGERLHPMARLSTREREVASLIAAGASNRGIAGDLGVSERTVESHVEHILRKLDLRGRSQIAAWVAAGDRD